MRQTHLRLNSLDFGSWILGPEIAHILNRAQLRQAFLRICDCFVKSFILSISFFNICFSDATPVQQNFLEYEVLDDVTGAYDKIEHE